MSEGVRPGASVLLDANVIIEAHRTKTWIAVSGAYQLETVEDCLMETQTGFQQRDPSLEINEKSLRDSLVAVHRVSEIERTELQLQIHNIGLDPGEKSLWAHALTRTDAWFLCGPDRASLRVGVQLQQRERIISLEELLQNSGYHRGLQLQEAYTKRWLDRVLSEIVVDESLT